MLSTPRTSPTKPRRMASAIERRLRRATRVSRARLESPARCAVAGLEEGDDIAEGEPRMSSLAGDEGNTSNSDSTSCRSQRDMDPVVLSDRAEPNLQTGNTNPRLIQREQPRPSVPSGRCRVRTIARQFGVVHGQIHAERALSTYGVRQPNRCHSTCSRCVRSRRRRDPVSRRQTSGRHRSATRRRSAPGAVPTRSTTDAGRGGAPGPGA